MKSAAELGATLRAAREEQKLGLADVSRVTGLPEKYLSALERGAYEDLPGRAYARLYFLNYARALNLNTDELMLSWPQTGYVTPPRPLPPKRREGRRIGLWISALLVVAAGAWGAVSLITGGGSVDKAPSPADTSAALTPGTVRETYADTSAEAFGVDSQFPDSTVGTAESSIVTDSTALDTVAAAPPVRHRLHLAAHTSSWVLIEADGDTVAARVINPGQTMNFEAEREFVLTIMLPNQVDATLDGEPLEIPFSGTGALLRHRIPLSSQETGT